MEIAYIVLNQTIMMFVLMAIGMILFKTKKLSLQGSKDLGSVLLYVVIPIVIIKSFWIEKNDELVQGLFLSFVLAVISLALAILVSCCVFKQRYPLDNFATSFSNAGFIGIPLVQAAVGKEAVFYIASYIVLLNILQWTYGVVIMTKRKDTISLKRLSSNPIILAATIGLLIFFLEIPMNDLVSSFMTTIAGLNTGLAMLVSGVYLAQVSILSMFQDKRLLLTSLLRLCVIPLVTLCIFSFFVSIETDIRLAVFIAGAAPVGSNIAIFASMYDKDYGYSVKTVCLTTILSIVTLPLMVMLAQSML